MAARSLFSTLSSALRPRTVSALKFDATSCNADLADNEDGKQRRHLSPAQADEASELTHGFTHQSPPLSPFRVIWNKLRSEIEDLDREVYCSC
ncbi:hypothetical protein EYF80_061612 [Liparis tanakae]|uniref:Uncharacterized protein n=1 Tax=Liparis tanakae TaxID=230148 RepID=A0A4Z2EI41_9TELE|nr:hypothetical protein EYF80_061612 [Liparis tanakae]